MCITRAANGSAALIFPIGTMFAFNCGSFWFSLVVKDLREIYGKKDKGSIEIGKHSSSENLSVYVDLHKLVLRHSAILGSTGSGKSNTTVSILKAILNDYKGSRVVLVDPHGEYSSAFPTANVFKIDDPQNPLYIPFWLMNFDELAYFLVGASQKEAIRPITIFRKNSLFAGNEHGGERAALFYSLLETCKLNDIDPYEYLKDVYDRIHDCPASGLIHLLPPYWKAGRLKKQELPTNP